MRFLIGRRATAVAVALGVTRAAWGQPSRDDPQEHLGRSSTGESDLRFRADRLELDPRLQTLELRGRVVLALGRYRLSGDRLLVMKTSSGMVVEGPGRLALCPCPNPAVTLGFTAARIAPPWDLVIENPTLRAGGVPVAWLPFFWLRSPRRVGLLPLKVAFRGDDGLLLGSGVHVPIGSDDQLDLRAAAYVRGGVDTEARLSTVRSESTVRWDYLGGSLLGMDSRGATSPIPGASASWSIDALRGSRSLSGPVLLEEAALRQDRARGALGGSDGRATFGLSVLADAARGGGVGDVGRVGPGAHAGYGAALGRVGTFDADVDVATFHDPVFGSMTLLTQHAEARADARAGVLSLGVQGRTRASAAFGEKTSGHAAAVGVSGRLAAPFVKRFGARAVPLEHRITPFVAGTVGAAHSTAASIGRTIAPDGPFEVVTSGIRTTVGELAGERLALTLELEGGGIADESEAPRGVVAVGAVGDARAFSVRQESVVAVASTGTAVHVLSARLGAADGPSVAARFHQSLGDVPILSRFALAGLGGGWDSPWVPWFGGPGSALGGRIAVPWTRWLSSAADSDYDVTNQTVLGVRGSLGYLHPCGCLRASLWGGVRHGRRGPDALLTLDFAP